MLFRVARETDSIALEADAWHLRTDVWTSAGVLAGLAAITVATRLGFREAHHLDPIIAIAVGIAIAKAALEITGRSWHQLVDRALPASEVERIENLLRDHYPQFAGYHGLRTRQAGSHRYVDLHLVVAGELAVEEAHTLCDHLESDVRTLIPGAEVMIHVEPKQRDE
jgi:cation diffusion facilitator family transporter